MAVSKLTKWTMIWSSHWSPQTCPIRGQEKQSLDLKTIVNVTLPIFQLKPAAKQRLVEAHCYFVELVVADRQQPFQNFSLCGPSQWMCKMYNKKHITNLDPLQNVLPDSKSLVECVIWATMISDRVCALLALNIHITIIMYMLHCIILHPVITQCIHFNHFSVYLYTFQPMLNKYLYTFYALLFVTIQENGPKHIIKADIVYFKWSIWKTTIKPHFVHSVWKITSCARYIYVCMYVDDTSLLFHVRVTIWKCLKCKQT